MKVVLCALVLLQVLELGVSAPASAEEVIARRPCATTAEEDQIPELKEFCEEEEKQNKIDKVCTVCNLSYLNVFLRRVWP